MLYNENGHGHISKYTPFYVQHVDRLLAACDDITFCIVITVIARVQQHIVNLCCFMTLFTEFFSIVLHTYSRI